MIHPKNIGWIINLVNQADLWWECTGDVNTYYEKSEYSEAFKSLDQGTERMSKVKG